MIQQRMSTITEEENVMREKIELYLYDTLAAIMYAAGRSINPFIEYGFATKLTLQLRLRVLAVKPRPGKLSHQALPSAACTCPISLMAPCGP
jgi:hypothetical protein